MSYFTKTEQAALEQLRFDPDMEPDFDTTLSCLIWKDEDPDPYSEKRDERLAPLWIARYFIFHSNLPVEAWPIDEEKRAYYQSCWEEAVQSGVLWPGFRKERLFLTTRNREYMLRKQETDRTTEDC